VQRGEERQRCVHQIGLLGEVGRWRGVPLGVRLQPRRSGSRSPRAWHRVVAYRRREPVGQTVVSMSGDQVRRACARACEAAHRRPAVRRARPDRFPSSGVELLKPVSWERCANDCRWGFAPVFSQVSAPENVEESRNRCSGRVYRIRLSCDASKGRFRRSERNSCPRHLAVQDTGLSTQLG
jgi:hypothetical protein